MIDAQLFYVYNIEFLQTFVQSAFIPYRVRGSLKFAYFSRKGLGPLAGRVFLEKGARSLGGARISRERG